MVTGSKQTLASTDRSSETYKKCVQSSATVSGVLCGFLCSSQVPAGRHSARLSPPIPRISQPANSINFAAQTARTATQPRRPRQPSVASDRPHLKHLCVAMRPSSAVPDSAPIQAICLALGSPKVSGTHLV